MRHLPSIRFAGPVLAVLGLIVAGAALAACGGSGGASASPSPSLSADPVVATVDGRPVQRSAVEAVLAEFRLGGDSSSEAKAVKEAVDRELVRHEAERLGVVADPADVRRRRKALAAELGGEAALAEALKALPMTEEQLQRDLEDGVLRETLQEQKYPGLKVRRETARTFYERHLNDLFVRPASVHLGAILVRAKLIAESALDRLRSGRPFEEVARQFTVDPEAEAKGGDLGWVLTSSLPVPLRRAAAATRPGALSKPFEGPGGWYVLKVLAERPARVTPFAAVERRLIEEITGRERFKALSAWLAATRGKAEITEP